MKNENVEVIEMQQTTFVQRHAKKILFATGVVVAAGAYYMLKKHDLEIKDLTDVNLYLQKSNDKLKDDVDTLMAAASEGLFEEALATTTRKLNSRKDRLQFLIDSEVVGEQVDKLTREIKTLSMRRDAFLKAQALVEIKELDA